MNESDPCNCEHRCPHGDRCLGGHAYSPNAHWYHCGTCSPPDGHGYALAAGGFLMVVEPCRHAIGPGPAAEMTREASRHRLSCLDCLTARTRNEFGGMSPPLTDLIGLDPNLTDGMEVDEYLRMIRGEDKF